VWSLPGPLRRAAKAVPLARTRNQSGGSVLNSQLTKKLALPRTCSRAVPRDWPTRDVFPQGISTPRFAFAGTGSALIGR